VGNQDRVSSRQPRPLHSLWASIASSFMPLFDLINLIAEDRIANPKRIDAMFQGLPQGVRDHIEKRDGKN
jgi:hypothetical protein